MFESRLEPCVALDFVVLRRATSVCSMPTRTPWSSVRSQGLRAELRRFIEDRGPHPLEDLVGSPWATPSTNELIERVCTLVDDGIITTSPRPTAAWSPAPTAIEPTPLVPDEAVGTGAAPEASPLAPETDTTRAQVATLVAASKTGVPFCAVCESPPTRSTRPASAGQRAQVDVLLQASAAGVPFCEVCN